MFYVWSTIDVHWQSTFHDGHALLNCRGARARGFFKKIIFKFNWSLSTECSKMYFGHTGRTGVILDSFSVISYSVAFFLIFSVHSETLDKIWRFKAYFKIGNQIGTVRPQNMLGWPFKTISIYLMLTQDHFCKIKCGCWRHSIID